MTPREIESNLGRLARVIDRNRRELDAALAERDALYEEGVSLGIMQLDLADWAQSTPGAVAKVLEKRRNALTV